MRYPDIEVTLTGTDGNAFALMGAVRKALRHGNVPQEEIEEFLEDARSGDYEHLISTCCSWVNVQ